MSELIQYGYAHGNYTCTCGTCKILFEGEKRASTCEHCAKNYLIESLRAEAEHHSLQVKGIQAAIDFALADTTWLENGRKKTLREAAK